MDSNPLEGRDLAAFVAACDSGSVQAAADILCITQSAATKRIQALERRLCVQLLERGRGGVRPTPAGAALYPDAREALEVLDRARNAVSEHSGAQVALRLAASYTIAEALVPSWLSGFRAENPLVTPQIDVTNSAKVLVAVRDGEADIGFIESLDPARGLDVMTLLKDKLVAVVAPDHRWAERSKISPSELATEPLLAREIGSGTRSVALDALSNHGVDLQPAMVAGSTESLKVAVLDGGFALISELSVKDEVRSGALRMIQVNDVELNRPLRAVRRQQPPAGDPSGRFWSWLSRTVAD
jgi:DNA-binding transcriptional LysR family regulator